MPDAAAAAPDSGRSAPPQNGLLCLDLGLSTGFAVGGASFKPGTCLNPNDADCESGSLIIAPPGTPHGQAWLAFGAVLQQLLDKYRPHYVVGERILVLPAGDARARLLMGMETVTIMCCTTRNLRFFAVHNSSVRKHMTGSGRSGMGKQPVMDACRALGFDPKDFDESDAIAIRDYAATGLLRRAAEFTARVNGREVLT